MLQGGSKHQKKKKNSLSSWTPISPDIPSPLNTLLCPLLTNLWACHTLIVAIVPLANILGDFDFGVALEAVTRDFAVGFPG